MTVSCCRFYGIATVFATPDLPSATVLSAMSYGFWNLFAGFIAPWAVRHPPTLMLPLFGIPCQAFIFKLECK